MALGTRMAWIRLGDRDRFIEDGLRLFHQCSTPIRLLHPVGNSSRCDSKPSGALNAGGIIVEFNPAAAAGPEGAAGHYF